MSEHDTYEDQGQLLADQRSPEYATSSRYRQGVQEKLQRTHAAGGFSRSQPLGELGSSVSYFQHGEGSTIHTGRFGRTNEPEGVYGGAVKLPGADPIFAEAAKVNTEHFFDGPEAIARAMAAPHYEVDAGYQQAVQEKIARSIREKFIDTNLQALDPAGRFTR
jgi:hypothetical protein